MGFGLVWFCSPTGFACARRNCDLKSRRQKCGLPIGRHLITVKSVKKVKTNLIMEGKTACKTKKVSIQNSEQIILRHHKLCLILVNLKKQDLFSPFLGNTWIHCNICSPELESCQLLTNPDLEKNFCFWCQEVKGQSHLYKGSQKLF